MFHVYKQHTGRSSPAARAKALIFVIHRPISGLGAGRGKEGQACASRLYAHQRAGTTQAQRARAVQDACGAICFAEAILTGIHIRHTVDYRDGRHCAASSATATSDAGSGRSNDKVAAGGTFGQFEGVRFPGATSAASSASGKK